MKLLMKEIKNALIGKKIFYFDSFNSEHAYFTIGFIQNESSSIRVHQERGKGWGVWIPKKHLPELIASGKVVISDTIEQCHVHKTFELLAPIQPQR